MINKNKYLVILVLGLFLSCCTKEGYKGSRYNGVYFSFKEKVTTIEIDEHVKSFKLHGIIVKNPDLFWFDDVYEILTSIRIDTIRTTARHKVHFINNVNKYKQGEGSNVYTEFELIPENIKSEVQIVYTSPFRLYGKDEPLRA